MPAPTQHTCPRRLAGWGPWERAENLDDWTAAHGLAGQDRVGLSCSFCGSLHPGRFMELVATGWIVGPTDKSYKFYLAEPLTDGQRAERKQRWMDTDGIARAIRDLGVKDGKSAEEIDADLEREWAQRWADLLSQGEDRAKFYTHHLSPDQSAEFYRLWQAGQVAWGYPGGPYRPLYLPGLPERVEE